MHQGETVYYMNKHVFIYVIMYLQFHTSRIFRVHWWPIEHITVDTCSVCLQNLAISLSHSFANTLSRNIDHYF